MADLTTRPTGTMGPTPGANVGSTAGGELQLPDRVDFDALVTGYFQRPAALNQLKERFEAGFRHIDRLFFSRSAAVILWIALPRRLLWRRDLVAVLEYRAPPELSIEFARTLFQADKIVTEAKRALRGSSLILCLEMVHAALTYLFKVADPPPTATSPVREEKPAQRSEAYSLVSEHLTAAQDFYLRAGARRAIMNYTLGMVVGSILIGGGLLALAPTFTRLPVPISPAIVSSCLGAGGLGALLSVMVRISRGELQLGQDLSNGQILLIGGFRPVVGVLSGVLVFVIVNSGLLPLKIPDVGGLAGTAAQWYFYVTLAFIAGFSERLVQDVIVRTETQFIQTERAKTSSARRTKDR